MLYEEFLAYAREHDALPPDFKETAIGEINLTKPLPIKLDPALADHHPFEKDVTYTVMMFYTPSGRYPEMLHTYERTFWWPVQHFIRTE